jgi:hypothetical protein
MVDHIPRTLVSTMSEQTPLLPPADSGNGTLRTENTEHLEENVGAAKGLSEHQRKIRQFVTGPLLFVLLVIMIILLFLRGDDLYNRWLLRGDPHTAAKRILSRWPVIVRHLSPLISFEPILTIIFTILGWAYRPSHTLPRVRSKQHIRHKSP